MQPRHHLPAGRLRPDAPPAIEQILQQHQTAVGVLLTEAGGELLGILEPLVANGGLGRGVQGIVGQFTVRPLCDLLEEQVFGILKLPIAEQAVGPVELNLLRLVRFANLFRHLAELVGRGREVPLRLETQTDPEPGGGGLLR